MKIEKEWNNKCGIYKIQCKTRCYIGSSKNLYERLLIHRSHLRSNKHHSIFMQRAYNKYGESEFTIKILEIIEYNETILREKELDYINQFNPKFNSTTPIEYHHSEEMKKKISNTLKKKYKSKEIINGRLGIGSRFNIYNSIGNLLYLNITSEECIKILNLSNRSVLNNQIRRNNGIYISKNGDYLILRTDKTFIDYINFIKNNYDRIPIYKIKDNKCIKSLSQFRYRNKDKMIHDILYYSKKEKSYYTFIGLFSNMPSNIEI